MITKITYRFDPKGHPVAEAKSGDTLVFETMDCFSNEICREDQLITSFDYNRANPASGPVFVTGAEPGDVLMAEIKAIEVNSQGVVTTLPHVGPLSDLLEVTVRTKVLKIKDGHTEFNGQRLPVSPMIGVIGTAPSGYAVPCGFPGSHGGNLDCNLMSVGAKAYFPVRVPGALFQLGDLHAVMGNGELCGTGLEVAGKVTVTLTLIKKTSLEWPVLETADRWYAMASAEDYTEALKAASRQICGLVSNAYGWDVTDTFFYLSLWGNLEVNQGCRPCPVPMVLRVGVPKRADKPLLRV